MKDEEIKLPPVPSLVTETDWHQAFINYGREAVRLNKDTSASERSQAGAWRCVVKVLDDLHPNWWLTGGATGVDAAIKVITNAFNSSKPNTEPLPFNLEAAKRGDVVVYGNDYLRWIGISQHHKGMNVLEGANGLTYAADCDLFMKPKPMRTVWVTQKTDGTLTVSDNELNQMCDAFNSECDTYTSSVLIPDRR